MTSESHFRSRELRGEGGNLAERSALGRTIRSRRPFSALVRFAAPVIALILAASGPAAADMVRMGNQVLTTGDSKMELLHVAGEPDSQERLETLFGGLAGERWYYTIEDNYPPKVVTFTIRGGRIVEIEEDLLY